MSADRSALPLVTFITVTRDNRDGLARTLASVARQTFRDFEHVVVDGASTDGSLALIEAHAGAIASYVSEPDHGIADAFNKGLAMSRGRWLNFLNAGDTLIDDDALARAVRHFGDDAIVSGQSVTAGVVSPPYPIARDAPFPRRAWLSHQATFFRRDVFTSCGNFDTRFRVCMDYEFFLRVLPRFPPLFVAEVWVDFEAGGVSSTRQDIWRREYRLANRMWLPNAPLVNLRFRLRLQLHRALERVGLFEHYRAWRHGRKLGGRKESGQ